MDKELSNISKHELEMKNISITNIYKINDYLFIELSNGQKFLTNNEKIYDVSNYDNVIDVFFMNNKLCAVVTKLFSKELIDIENMEVLFDDKNAYQIYKQDDKTIRVIMKIGHGKDAIYNIETKKYLPSPKDYEFENSLGNDLYVFKECFHSNTNFFDYKRCVINKDGKIIMKDIEGWIETSDNNLIIKKEDKLLVVSINEDSNLNVKTIEQNDDMIAKPIFHNGFIFLLQKGVIKKYTPNLEVVEEFIIEELEEVIDLEIVDDVLKLCLPYKKDEKQINKHLFFNLNTGKIISDIRINGYPYWNPTTYISEDGIFEKTINYNVYNKDFDLIKSISANSYESAKGKKENMFIFKINEENKFSKLLNSHNGNLTDINYDYIQFHHTLPYGYGLNLKTEKMDFFDEDLNVIVPNVDYKKFNLSFHFDGFSYFIINDYVCIQKHFVDGFGRSKYRTIIQKSNGDVLLDSSEHKCYPVGDFIQIVNNNESKFLNTITGETGPLEIMLPVNDKEKFDIKQYNDFSIQNNMRLSPPKTKEKTKVKKINPPKK